MIFFARQQAAAQNLLLTAWVKKVQGKREKASSHACVEPFVYA